MREHRNFVQKCVFFCPAVSALLLVHIKIRGGVSRDYDCLKLHPTYIYSFNNSIRLNPSLSVSSDIPDEYTRIYASTRSP